MQGNDETETLPRLSRLTWLKQFDPVSPRMVVIFIPLLVLLIGVALTLVGQGALGEASREMARDQYRTQGRAVQLRLADTLAPAEAILDRVLWLADRFERRPPQQEELQKNAALPERFSLVAKQFRALLVGRPAITETYLGYSDGLFFSLKKERGAYEVFSIGTGEQVFEYRPVAEEFVLHAVRRDAYDPRERPWYIQASEKNGRIWSDPYSFHGSDDSGVTRADIRELSSGKRVVGGVDINVHDLSEFMQQSEMPGAFSVVFSASGELLAYPHGAEALHVAAGKDGDRADAVTYEEIADPVLHDFMEAWRARPPSDDFIELAFQSEGDAYLAFALPSFPNGPGWTVAVLSPQRFVLRAMAEYRGRSLLVGGLSLAFAAWIAWLFARQIVLARREAKEARRDALAVRSELRQLGAYQLIRMIGQGAMGEVWVARHRLLARQSAIKLIKNEAREPDQMQVFQERFRREARAIAALRSRHTVEIFDYGVTEEGTRYYVMELLDGINLQSLLEEYGPQPAERVRRILMQACSSLAEAHDAGLVHRDIKPANLFICRAADEVDVVKVLDFGLVLGVEPHVQLAKEQELGVSAELELSESASIDARSNEAREAAGPAAADYTLAGLLTDQSSDEEARLTGAYHQLGTPAYMSPEQALGKPTDGRADLYSLGCVAVWLLTGRAPFSGPTLLSVMLQHIREEVEDFRARTGASKLSDEFYQLIRWCLQKNPDDRPDDALALKAQLQALGEQGKFGEDEARIWWAECMSEQAPRVSLPQPSPQHQPALIQALRMSRSEASSGQVGRVPGRMISKAPAPPNHEDEAESASSAKPPFAL